MKMNMYTFATFATFATMVAIPPLATPVLADEQSDRAGLVGSWIQPGGNNAWIIGNASDGLHITQIEGSGPVADYQCNLEGRDCDVKIGGHKASVSMYYNGSMLVQVETKGDQIVKRRFSVLPTGAAMKVEVIPMTGKAVQTEELQFERGQPVARKK